MRWVVVSSISSTFLGVTKSNPPSSFDEFFNVNNSGIQAGVGGGDGGNNENDVNNINNINNVIDNEDDYEIKFLDPTPINSPRLEGVATYAAQPSTISTKNDAFFLRESYEPIGNLGVGSKFMNSSTGNLAAGGGGMQPLQEVQQKQQEHVKRPMRKMSQTQSQSPISSPARGAQALSPPSSPINVVVQQQPRSGVRMDMGTGRGNLSNSLPSPLQEEEVDVAVEQQRGVQGGRRQQQQQRQEEHLQTEQQIRQQQQLPVQPAQSAFGAKRNNNKLSSSR